MWGGKSPGDEVHYTYNSVYPWQALHNAPVACVKNVSNNFIRDYLPWGNKYFLVIFASITLKLEKFGAVYSSFNPCAALLFVLKDNRKQIQWLLKDPFTWARLAGLALFPRSCPLVYTRGRAGSVPEISVFPIGISVSRLRESQIFVFGDVCFVSRISRQNSSSWSLPFFHLRNRTEISHMHPRRNNEIKEGSVWCKIALLLYTSTKSACFWLSIARVETDQATLKKKGGEGNFFILKSCCRNMSKNWSSFLPLL